MNAGSKLLDTLGQGLHIALRRHPETVECARHTILEHLFKFVPGFSGLRLRL